MATTITGKLNKPANQFQAGESTGFGVRLGVQVFNPKTKEKQWTNYSAVFFSKNQNMIQYMQNVLIENAVIEVTATGELIQEYEGNYSIDLLDAKLGYAYSGQQAPQQQNNQQGFQQNNFQPNNQQGSGFQQNNQQGSGFQQNNQQQNGGYAQNTNQGGFQKQQ